MRKIIFMTLLLSISGYGYAQDGTILLPRINKIVASDNSIVKIKQDDGTSSMELKSGNKSNYEIEDGVLSFEGIVNAVVRISNLNQIKAEDVSNITVEGGLSKGVEIVGKDASKIKVDGQLDKVVVEANDATNIKLEGKCNSLNITAHDASKVHGGMKSDYLVAKSYDVANIQIAGDKYVDTQINDQSNIEILKAPSVEGADTISLPDITPPEDVYVEGDIDMDKDVDKWNKKKLKWRPAQRVWAGFEMSVVGLSNELFEFQPNEQNPLWRLDQPSVSFHVNLLEHKFKLGTEYLKFVTGLGFQWDILRFKNDVTLVNSRDKVELLPSAFGTELKKNNLVLGQIQIPLLLNINTNPGNKYNFHIDGGVVVGYRFKQYQKQSVYTNYKTTIEQTTSSQFHQNPFDFSATVRLGIGDWSIFGMYDLASLYQKNEGPDLKSWNIGITIIPF
ncbi:MAG: outer membrane beta-barrel protein [Saprospiraceae bacterium]|nr:outer membrane beta-barrel protein [Saprospiraceae bacterium]